jgi:type I restriction enzyme S subunit
MSSKTKTTATKEEATPALVPKLRFPEFQEAEDWQKKEIGNVCEILNNRRRPITESERQPGPYPYYGASGIVDFVGDFIFDERLLLVGEDGAKWGAFERTAFIAEGQYWVNNHAHVLKPFAIIDTLLENYLTMTDLGPFVTGAAPPKLTLGKLKGIPIPVPPTTAEQQKIAECLSSVGELIAAQARKLDALKIHKKGLMQQLFPRAGKTQPHLRFPEFQNAREWVLTSVGGMVEKNCLFPPKDGNHGNIHPKSSDFVANGIPFIMASDLNGGLIDIETCHFISKEQADKLQKGFAKEGDVLLSHKGTVGEVAVVRKIQTPYLMLTPQVTYYRVKDRKKLSNEFLAQLFVSDSFQSNLLEVSGGGTRAYIGITEQAKLRVQLPIDVTEQQRIADCLTSLDDLIAAQTQKHEALKTHKKGLMQQLFPSTEEVEA